MKSQNSFTGWPLVLSILVGLSSVFLIVMRMMVLKTPKSSTNRVENEMRESLTRWGFPKRLHRTIIGHAKHESGDFTNKLSKMANNIFSMKQPRRRKTTSIGTIEASEGTFAKFGSVDSAIEDLALWFDDGWNIDVDEIIDTDDYIDRLASVGFFEQDPELYRLGVKRNMKGVA